VKGQLKVSTPAEYIETLDGPRRSDIAALDALIRKGAPKLEPFIHAGMLAYGPWHYKYDSGREGDWFHIGLASNKNYISLYVCAADAKGYLAGCYRELLPKASISKSCVRFKRLADVDQKVIAKMLREASKLAAKA
jgi:Domain of unknown function (DU1801)